MMGRKEEEGGGMTHLRREKEQERRKGKGKGRGGREVGGLRIGGTGGGRQPLSADAFGIGQSPHSHVPKSLAHDLLLVRLARHHSGTPPYGPHQLPSHLKKPQPAQQCLKKADKSMPDSHSLKQPLQPAMTLAMPLGSFEPLFPL